MIVNNTTNHNNTTIHKKQKTQQKKPMSIQVILFAPLNKTSNNFCVSSNNEIYLYLKKKIKKA